MTDASKSCSVDDLNQLPALKCSKRLSRDWANIFRTCALDNGIQMESDVAAKLAERVPGAPDVFASLLSAIAQKGNVQAAIELVPFSLTFQLSSTEWRKIATECIKLLAVNPKQKIDHTNSPYSEIIDLLLATQFSNQDEFSVSFFALWEVLKLLAISTENPLMVVRRVLARFDVQLSHGSLSPDLTINFLQQCWLLLWEAPSITEHWLDFDEIYRILAKASPSFGPQFPNNYVGIKNAVKTQPPGVCYISFTPEVYEGIGALTHSLVYSHAKFFPQDRVHLLVMRNMNQRERTELDAFYNDVKVTIISPLVPTNWEITIERQRKIFEQNFIDTAFYDSSFVPTAFCMMKRLARYQIGLDFTNIHCCIPGIDWWFLHTEPYRAGVGKSIEGATLFRTGRVLKTIRPAKISAAERIKQSFSRGKPVVGAISRFVKFSPPYLATLKTLLEQTSDCMILLAGSGDPSAVNAWANSLSDKSRVLIVNEHVDIAEYGPVFDIFADTFPFQGGESPSECSTYGVPIVTLYEPQNNVMIVNQRDPALVARDCDEYLAHILSLLNNPVSLKDAGQRTLAFSKFRENGLVETIKLFRDKISELRALRIEPVSRG